MRTTFTQLGLPEKLVRALATQDVHHPFPVQAAVIPDVLAGRDVCGKAPTGSGKTLAFGLPLLVRSARATRNRPTALVLSPTRELAEQIKQDLAGAARTLGRSIDAVYGGVSYGPQKASLRRGLDVLVATPGRLEDLIEQRCVDLSRVGIAVVDEADRMAHMGFLPAVRRILDSTSSERQTLLFSATLDGDVAVLSKAYQGDPLRHEADTAEHDGTGARHHFWLVDRQDRVQHTAEVIDSVGRSIVFTRTRRGADRVARQLGKYGVGAVAMHGGLSQRQRQRALTSFASRRSDALVATDVAARGIHVDAVASVVHFDMPTDHKDYLHRSGRTARAGATGTVVSLVTREERRAAQRLQRRVGLSEPIGAPRVDSLPSEGLVDAVQASPPAKKTKTTATRRPASHTTQNRAVGGKNASVYVGNLPWAATEADLVSLFRPHGKVRKTTIVVDRRTGRSRGFGFVDMAAPAAKAAIVALNGIELRGRTLTVGLGRPSNGQRPNRRRSR